MLRRAAHFVGYAMLLAPMAAILGGVISASPPSMNAVLVGAAIIAGAIAYFMAAVWLASR